MTQEQKIIRVKVGLLELAKPQGSGNSSASSRASSRSSGNGQARPAARARLK